MVWDVIGENIDLQLMSLIYLSFLSKPSEIFLKWKQYIQEAFKKLLTENLSHSHITSQTPAPPSSCHHMYQILLQAEVNMQHVHQYNPEKSPEKNTGREEYCNRSKTPASDLVKD